MSLDKNIENNISEFVDNKKEKINLVKMKKKN